MVFLLAETPSAIDETAETAMGSSAIGNLRQMAALLEGLRAQGSGRVLDEVLALVVDSAIVVGGDERGFVMLSSASGELEFKVGRGPRERDVARQPLRNQPQYPRGGVQDRPGENRSRSARRRPG